MKAPRIFRLLTLARDPVAEVAKLSPARWAKVYQHLLRNYDESAPSGEILGLMLVEGARRYAEQTAKRKKTRKVLG